MIELKTKNVKLKTARGFIQHHFKRAHLKEPERSNLKNGAGFILPFAVFLSGVMLAIGLAVFNIILKEAILASSGRESQFAFYSADTGGECALYWDAKQGIFPTSSGSTVYTGPASCAGYSITPFDSVVGNASAATTTFDINTSSHCVVVTVAKYGDNKTKIESEGLSTCNTADPRRVERALRILY